MSEAPAASSRFIANSGDVCKKSSCSRGAGRQSLPASLRVTKGSRYASTTMSRESRGVSTSQRLRERKNSRVNSSSPARNRNCRSSAEGPKARSSGAGLGTAAGTGGVIARPIPLPADSSGRGANDARIERLAQGERCRLVVLGGGSRIFARHSFGVDDFQKLRERAPRFGRPVPQVGDLPKEGQFVLEHRQVLDGLDRIDILRLPGPRTQSIRGIGILAQPLGNIDDDRQVVGRVEFRGKHPAGGRPHAVNPTAGASKREFLVGRA